MKPQPPADMQVRHCWFHAPLYGFTDAADRVTDHWWKIRCPYGTHFDGDRLWVKETWHHSLPVGVSTPAEEYREPTYVDYRADIAEQLQQLWKWKPSIFMPRWASRITLEITDVRVERLQGISEEDAIAEGAEPWQFGPEQCLTSGERGALSPYRSGYACLWDDINADRATWYSNPWVWALTFREVPA
jgi:hypothetical protein